MLIDSHTHIGHISYPVGKNRVSCLPAESLIEAMDKYSVDRVLVSGIEGAEFDSAMNLPPAYMHVPQLDAFRKQVAFARANKGRVGVLLWIKPYTETVTDDLEQFILSNRDCITGFKMHPALSNLMFTDKRFLPYLELADRLNMPVQVHTENDGRSDPAYVAEVAAGFPELDFVMVHMGLGTDNKEAINIIRDNANIYGDTCEVEIDNVFKAVDVCGSEKILFGTDAVVHGKDTYKRYQPLIDALRNRLDKKDAGNILYANCLSLFG